MEGRQEYIASLQAWHKRLSDQQAVLEASFDMRDVKDWSVNLWDDFPDKGTTYGYVEMGFVPDYIYLDLLMHLLVYTRGNSQIRQTGVNAYSGERDRSLR